MKKVISTLGLDRIEWLKYRKQGIGGSDVGAICGMNPYKSIISVYQDKITDDVTEIDNEAMRQGRDFEDYVAKRFTQATGKKVRKANAMFCHDEYSFMIADVDRMIVGEAAGLECKTASPYMAEKWKDGNIPLSYQLQCYHYMAVCNTNCWYVAVLIYGKEFKVYKLERDESIIQNLINLEKIFWENCVQKRILPDPDGSKIADFVLAEHFKTSINKTLPLIGYDDKLNRRQELIEIIEKMETEKRQIEQELKVYLGESETAENTRYRVSWKPVFSRRLDEKRLKEEKPEIYDNYCKTISSRRFQIKSAS